MHISTTKQILIMILVIILIQYIHCVPVGGMKYLPNLGKAVLKRPKHGTNTSGPSASQQKTVSKRKNTIATPTKSSTSIITHEKPHSWPNTKMAINFPAPIRTSGTNNGKVPINHDHVTNTINRHREELNAYHLLHRDYSATHAIGSQWSQSQIAKNLERIGTKKNR